MTFRRSRFVVLIHVLLLIIGSAALAFVLRERNMLFVPLTILLVLIAVVASLLRYLEKTTTELTRFLLSIREGAFMDERGRTSHPLTDKFGEALNEITREFARVSMDKEIQYQYLQTLNEHIGAGIISVLADGTVRMINPAAKQILGLTRLQKLSDITRVDPHLYDLILEMNPEQSELYKFTSGDEEIQLSIRMKEMILQDVPIKIFVLQDINSEIGQNEIEAWQQLTRVLTHEIMNSVTPIAALSKASQRILHDSNGTPRDLQTISAENLEDVQDSVNTIASRSDSLLKFVSNYRAFTKPMVIERSQTDLIALLNGVLELLKPEAKRNSVSLHFVFSLSPLQVNVDKALMEQLFINLIKNAIESILPGQQGSIFVELALDGKKVKLSIADNGKGIPPEIVSKIFVPFFTTKVGGSGVGLSLVRQILLAHRGTIRVKSIPNMGTTFFLEWRVD